ncbi:hypothetical protein KR222_009402 [Zaprionus bogoriensis]|nr:hypothetical protein KR222_009402 [Zaprionus bogoriensis]
MSDEEEESLSEGFSASEEDEWKPGKDARGGESSDDDDSDFEELPPGANAAGAAAPAAAGSARSPANSAKKRQAINQGEQKPPSGIKGASVKKRKPSGQSLRSKLYNKYRPPPKTFPTSPTQNSPSASGSATASKNAKTPNESNHAADDDDSSSESSVEDYLVNPAELDLRSDFFASASAGGKEKSPVPQFDCNAGIPAQMSGSDSGSGSEDNNDSSLEEPASGSKAFDFRGLLENANSLERTREALLSKCNAAATPPASQLGSQSNTSAMDVGALLALGENQNYAHQPEKEKESRRDGAGAGAATAAAAAEPPPLDAPSRLSKTKSTRIKRHTKTRPTSTVVLAAAGDTDDSDFEEVADALLSEDEHAPEPNISGDLEIHVGLPSRRLTKEQKTQHELELALKRRMNRDIKDRQLLLHKVSLLCLLSRCLRYNRLLGDSQLMQSTLKLLPSKNAYPTERGVELKYLQSFVTWFKTALKLQSQDLYPSRTASTQRAIVAELLEQIKRKQARCKQDMIFIFIVLARGMGMNCRLVVNLQPMALRPAAADLIPIKMKPEEQQEQEEQLSEQDEEDEQAHKPKQAKAKPKGKPKEAAKSVAKAGASSKEAKPQPEQAKSSSSRAAPKLKASASLEAEAPPKPSSRQRTAGKLKASASLEAEEVQPCASRQLKLSKLKSASSLEQEQLQPSATCNAKPQTAPKLKASASLEQEQLQPSTTSSSKSKTASKLKTSASLEQQELQPSIASKTAPSASLEEQQELKHSSAEASSSAERRSKPQLSRLKREPSIPDAVDTKKKLKLSLGAAPSGSTPVARRTRKASAEKITRATVSESRAEKIGSPVIPKLVLPAGSSRLKNAKHSDAENANPSEQHAAPARETRSRSKSPKVHISPKFLKHDAADAAPESSATSSRSSTQQQQQRKRNSLEGKACISPTFLLQAEPVRQLRTRQQKAKTLGIPQLDGGDDSACGPVPKKRLKLEKLQKSQTDTDDSMSTPSKTTPPTIKKAPVLPKAVQQLRKDRRVLSTDDESVKEKRKTSASDMWVEVWSEVEEQWICIDLCKGKLHCVDTIRRNASPNLAYVFAFQDDQSLKDVTARYCTSWTTTVRKSRVEKSWLDETIAPYLGRRTKRDIAENEQLRRIHSDKPLPKSISEFKDHPLYVLERHLLKFQGIYPADAPTLGFIRGEAVYSRDCVHLLHSRDIWLKSARVVKLGEQPYKIVKARPKWDKLTRSVIKDQPLEIFGYWQTQDYEPPTAENGLVPRNAYGNVELFKECMLPKKTVHLRLPGLMRICKKLNIDCANAVIGFDFHQGACHPMYDGFVICEEFAEIVTAAWEEDQQEQARKEQEKYEARVYGNWKKLIKGLLIRERLKRKYNF